MPLCPFSKTRRAEHFPNFGVSWWSPGFRDNFSRRYAIPNCLLLGSGEFPLLTGKPQGPILTRLDTFLRPKVIRYMVSQRENRIDFASIMNGRKILLAKLAQGLIGEENSYLLGTLIVSKFNHTAMSRQNMATVARPTVLSLHR